MPTNFKSNMVLLFVLSITFLIIACNNASEKKAETNDTTVTNSGQLNQPTALASGKLDTLVIDSASFVKLPDTTKVVFVFTFKPNDTLTLDGWTAKQDTIFTTDPDIELIKYAPSTLSYGNGIYFGNVILKKREVKKIKNMLNNQQAHSVLFAPQLVNGKHIGYEIFLSLEHLPAERLKNAIATQTFANPSPPKNY
jgi:hypothetical protein